MTIGASDPSGISQIVILRLRTDGSIKAYTYSLSNPETGEFTYSVPFAAGDRYVLEVVDGANNVANYTGKGSGLTLIHVEATADATFTPGIPASFTATIGGFDDLVKPVFYWWDFGDFGNYQHATGIAPSDNFTIPFDLDWTASSRNAVLKVVDSDGGVGVDSTSLNINKVDSIVRLDSSLNGVLYIGQYDDLTVTVSANTSGLLNTFGMPVPTGTVTFLLDGDTELGTIDLDADATATFTTQVQPGTHTIAAEYNGDDYYNSGTSDGVSYSAVYGGVVFKSPLSDSQYKIGRTIPVKFTISGADGNAVTTATGNIFTQLNGDDLVDGYGPVTYANGLYQYNLDSALILGAKVEDRLVIWVLLDDGTWHDAYPVWLK